MMCALSVVLMLMGGLIPVMLYVAPLLAGILLLPVLVEYGRTAAWLTWFATALCVLMIGVDKEAAFFYLFIGYYPILKWEIDRKIAHKGLRIAVKLLLFTASAGLMYLLLWLIFPAQSLAAEFGNGWLWMSLLLLVLMDFCLLMYDRALIAMVVLYDRKMRPVLKFLRR
jgi:hypothetical protein